MNRLILLAVCGVAALIADTASAEGFVDFGLASNRIESDIANQPGSVSRTESGLHVGIGARRKVAERSDLSVRIEIDDVGSDTLLTIRAFDYRYHISEKLAASAFFGAARLDLATPAYGYYVGGGIQWKEIAKNLDLNVDLRLGDKVARDNLLPSDPQGGRPDNFYDITGLSLYLSYRF